MEAALASLAAHAEDAIRQGYNILILSDRSVSPATAADSRAARDRRGARAPGQEGPAHVARAWSSRPARRARCTTSRCSRATAPRRSIPYLALETLAQLAQSVPGIDPKESHKRFIKAICKGLNKVMSKMGISTYQSYCGAQIFEAVGLQKAFVDKYFTGTASNVEGIGLFEVAEEAVRLHALAFGDDPLLRDMLDAGGEYMYRVRGEAHMWTPESIAKLQHAARANSYVDVSRIRDAHQRAEPRAEDVPRAVRVQDRRARAGADRGGRAGQATIVKRFATGAMSLGSISTEAHTTLAVAMNRIGGKSNTGEGGEDEARYRAELRTGKSPVGEGDTLASRARPRPRRSRRAAQGRRQPALEDQAGRVRRASASPRSTCRRRTSSRSRWRRARSPAKAGSCPATRCPSTSPSCATRCPAWA